MAYTMVYTELKQYLKARVLVDPETGCWNWLLHTRSNGWGKYYPVAKYHGKQYYAHRLALMAWRNFDITSKSLVCHHCDNEKCLNPDHLYAGTHQDNMDDMKRRGRHRTRDMRGTKNPRARLMWGEVWLIRRLLAAGIVQLRIAKMFKLSQQTVSAIKMNRSWK